MRLFIVWDGGRSSSETLLSSYNNVPRRNSEHTIFAFPILGILKVNKNFQYFLHIRFRISLTTLRD